MNPTFYNYATYECIDQVCTLFVIIFYVCHIMLKNVDWIILIRIETVKIKKYCI